MCVLGGQLEGMSKPVLPACMPTSCVSSSLWVFQRAEGPSCLPPHPPLPSSSPALPPLNPTLPVSRPSTEPGAAISRLAFLSPFPGPFQGSTQRTFSRAAKTRINISVRKDAIQEPRPFYLEQKLSVCKELNSDLHILETSLREKRNQKEFEIA